ncbi:MAG TPA: UDP-N-acetylmuramoyl-tripeptide--D-alanyl-D-alanine ligase [Bryobacteraceae bacterium]|jgi:UDP-N-acetylmuramoyl-tripeptide--D-alanyl-D-alanine ligase|nr:UDP-N-acetylmuramoyl-tripeptide--D-alanyl-D-alanine ligase [Bryobacteraceae bacterium]
MELSLGEVKESIGAKTSGPASDAQLAVMRAIGWSIDSRQLNPGDLFFAIKGNNFNGHAFVEKAFDRGAVAAVVSETPAHPSCPALQVPDTIAALQKLAVHARNLWNKPLVAITGSAGKTSTKEIVAVLLSTRFLISKTVGNLNNHLGLPLTLLRLNPDADIGVVELGMNRAGELRHLAAIARPQIGVVTNVGYAHIEAFSSIEGIAAAKRELIEALPPDGVAVLNADDARVAQFNRRYSGKVLTYGLAPSADIRAVDLQTDWQRSSFIVNGTAFSTRLTGRHAVSNILAGLAVASLFEIPFPELVDTVRELAPGKMRGERRQSNGITILDDSYNSNPEAARSMLDVLAVEPATRRIAVLGEMLELGSWSDKLHAELGEYAAHLGIDILIGIRGASRHMVEQAIHAGMGKPTLVGSRAALFFEDPESAGDFLRSFVKPGDAVLFKGSRGTHVEQALAEMEK